MIEVEGPDGAVIEFPDGTPPETIKGVMAKRYGRGPAAQPSPSASPFAAMAAADDGRTDLRPSDKLKVDGDAVLTEDGQSRLVGTPDNFSFVPVPGAPVAKRPSRVGDSLIPLLGRNPVAEAYDQFVDPFVPDGEGRHPSEQEWLQSRGLADKAGEAAAAALSTPMRMATQGQHGFGAVARWLGAPGWGETADAAEQDFYRAYRPQLGALAAAGEGALAGSPSMVPRPRLPASAPVRRAPSGGPPTRARTAAEAAQAREARERMVDIQAFRDLEMEPFGPALNDKGIAQTARTIEDLPIIGRQIKRTKERTEGDLLSRRDQLVGDLGAAGSDEATGRLVQGALDRYRTAGLQDLDPQTVRDMNVPVVGPAPRVGIGRPALQRAQAAAQAAPQVGATTVTTARGAVRPASTVQSTLGAGRSRISQLSDAELNRVIATPSATTSFATRSEALYEKAWRGVPRLNQPDGTPDPMHIDPTNTRRAVTQIIQGESDARVASRVMAGRFGPALSDIADIRSAPGARNSDIQFDLGNLRSLRTEVGKALGRFDDYDTGMDRQQLSQLYASLSTDIEVGLRDLANRTVLAAQSGAATPEMAQRATQAVRDFETANRYFRQGMGRMETFNGLLNASSPDEAARKIGRALREQTSNMPVVREVLSVLRPEERQSVVGHVIGSWGRKRVGHGDFEQVFNITNWRVEAEAVLRNPEAARLILEPLSAEQRKALTAMLRVARRMEAYERRRNYVNASVGLGGVSAAGVGLSFFNGPAGATAAGLAIGGAALMGHFLTSPRYVSWLEQHYRAVNATPRQRGQSIRNSLRRLAEIARGDPEHGDDILRLIGSSQTAQTPLALPAPAAAQQQESSPGETEIAGAP